MLRALSSMMMLLLLFLWGAAVGCGPEPEPLSPGPEGTVSSSPLESTTEVPRGEDPSRWPEFLGPTRDGRAAHDPDMEGVQDVRLERLWRVPLGSGHSQVVVDSGRLFTQIQGETELLIALDAGSGAELWRHSIPPVEGEEPAQEGPLSTPAVSDGVVFALAPRGQLVAVDAASGDRLWIRELIGDLGAHFPDFGLATSPMIFEGRLIVQVGAPGGRMVCSLEPGTGETQWCTGSDGISYQSPARVRLLGRDQIIAISNGALHGLDAETGEVVWTQSAGAAAGVGYAHVIPAGEDRLLIQGVKGSSLVQLAGEYPDGVSVMEIWSNERFRNSFDLPVYHRGHFYSFGDKIMACLDAAMGEPLWQSRAPGGGQAILVEDLLALWAPDGALHVVRASPERYEEITSLELLGEGSLTTPSYADGVVYVRNATELAAARIVPLEP